MRRDAGEVEHGRPEVNEAHEAIGACAALVVDEVLEVFRDAHDERHVQSALVGVALAARHHTAVVAKVKNERVLQQAVLLELADDAPDVAVDDAHPVVVPRLGVAHDRRVGEVRLQHDVIGRCLGRCLHLFQRKVQPALVRIGERLHVEKRHGLVWPLAPRGLVGGHIPRLLHVDLEVVVRLRVVGGVVTVFAQHL